MDRGEQSNMPSGDRGIEGVAGTASARVGEILADAEQLGRSLREEAERDAAATREAAEEEVRRIAAEARERAREAARERAARLAELQAALTARGPAVVDGLEGAGVTRARLEALIEALGAAAERVKEEAEQGDPRGGSAAPAPPPAEEDGAGSAETADEEGTETEAAARGGAPAAIAGDGEEPGDRSREQISDGNGTGSPGRPTPYDGPLPEGAPLARRPMRSRERDARFAALLLAVKGRDRGHVESHLRDELGVDDCGPILDEVFGPARA
jgi:hypothetical protein